MFNNKQKSKSKKRSYGRVKMSRRQQKKMDKKIQATGDHIMALIAEDVLKILGIFTSDNKSGKSSRSVYPIIKFGGYCSRSSDDDDDYDIDDDKSSSSSWDDTFGDLDL